MSDAVKNTEIEDVLSSIRRLVSDNRTGDAKDGATGAVNGVETSQQKFSPEADATPAESPMALVLTPAQRVGEEDAEPEEAEVVAADTPLNGEETLRSARHADEFSFDADIVRASKEDRYDPEDPFAVSHLEAEDDLDIEAFASATLPDEELVSENAVDHLEESSVEDAEEAYETMSDADIEEASGEDLSQDVVEADQPFDFKQVLEARIHQFRDAETAEEAAAIDIEMAEREHHAEDSDAADAMMADLESRIQDEVVQSAELPGIEALAETLEEAAEIDEAMLREMVADIVRQELQGALGERITRNVRKLVRREIHRALAAHDLG